MSSNLVLREDLCEGMKGGIICMCHQLQLSYWERSQLRRVWRSYLHVGSGLPPPLPAAAVITKVRFYKPPAQVLIFNPSMCQADDND